MEIFKGDFLKFNFGVKYKNGTSLEFKKGDLIIVLIKHKFFDYVPIEKIFEVLNDSTSKEIYISSDEMKYCMHGLNKLEIKLKRGSSVKTMLQNDLYVKESELI